MVPTVDIDKLQLIMYKFFDLCEESELFSSRGKVEKKVKDLFSWSMVRIKFIHIAFQYALRVLQVSPKIWANYFERIKREIRDKYGFCEFFGIYLAVESGEFLSTADPDAYMEPGKQATSLKNFNRQNADMMLCGRKVDST
jgi:hypothetical protein